MKHMKRMMAAFLTLILVLGLALPAMAAPLAAANEEIYVQAGDEEDEELRAWGEALLRGTLDALSGEFTIYEEFGDNVISYNGTYVATTWGIRRLIGLFKPGTYYTVNRSFRMYFDHKPADDSTYTKQLFTLIQLDMPEEFRVRNNNYIIVDFEENGFEFTFFYQQDGSLDAIWMSVRTSSNSRSTNSLQIDRIEPQAISSLFDLSWMIRMPGWLYDPITYALFPYSMLLMMIRTIGDAIGIRWW